MDTHGIRRRQPHNALRKKRFQPARLPGLHGIGLENNAGRSEPVDRRSIEERQIAELPGFTFPLTDLFPPTLPTASSTTETTTSTPTPTPTASPTQESTTETTSTTTSSTTSTSTTPTTTTTRAATLTTTSTPTASTSRVIVTEVDNETAVLTSFFGQSSSTAATASSTTLSSTGGDDDSNTGPIVGGIVAGVIALAVVVIALVWWIRRRRREKLENDITPFNPHDFRRSAYLINDEPQDSGGASLHRGPTFNRGAGDDPMSAHSGFGANPRPPSMIERKLAQTPVNGYDAGFAPYPSSSHGHGDFNGAPPMTGHPMPLHYYDGGSTEGYGYGAGVGAGPAAYGFNQFQVFGDHPHYSGAPFQSYGPEQGAGPQHSSYAVGQVADPNLQNPFMTPSQGQGPQLQSPFSPPSSTHEITADSIDRETEQANAGNGTAVLAQVGGAAVLTRSVSTKSKHSAKGNLSISIPKNIPVNATAINGSAEDKKKAVEYPELKRQGSSSSVSTLRSAKKGNAVKAPPPALPIKEDEPIPSSDYVDLTRSSVSPFQAAQYAEISKRLNTDVPQGLSNTTVDEYVTTRDRDLPPLPPPTQAVDAHRNSAISNTDSSSSSITGGAPNMLDFPAPPPSPLTITSRHSVGQSSLASAPVNDHLAPKLRVDSLPPQLPEITIGSSSKGHDSFLNPPPGMSVMMSMGLNSAKDSPIYPSGITAGASPLLGKFPVTPSPLGMSFDFDSPKVPQGPSATQGTFARHQEVKVPAQQQLEAKQDKGKAKERPVTVYDEDDAYGGM